MADVAGRVIVQPAERTMTAAGSRTRRDPVCREVIREMDTSARVATSSVRDITRRGDTSSVKAVSNRDLASIGKREDISSVRATTRRAATSSVKEAISHARVIIRKRVATREVAVSVKVTSARAVISRDLASIRKRAVISSVRAPTAKAVTSRAEADTASSTATDIILMPSTA